MREFKNEFGTQDVRPLELELLEKIVLVRSKIRRAEGDVPGWMYDEVEYTKDEYIALLDAQGRAQEQQITDTQLALCELFENMA